MFVKKMFMEEAGGAAGGAEKKSEPVANPDVADLSAKLKAAEESSAKLAAELAAKNAAEKALADKKAVENGEAEKLLAQKNSENQALKKQNEEFIARETARADAMYAKLSDAEKKLADSIKTDLPLAKYAAYLEGRVGVAAITAPVGTPGAGTKFSKERELHPETVMVLDSMGASEQTKIMGKKLNTFKRGGKDVFRYGGTGNDLQDTRAFIGLLNSIAAIDQDKRSRGVSRALTPKDYERL